MKTTQNKTGKRWILALAVLLALAVSLSGCGKKIETPEVETDPAETTQKAEVIKSETGSINADNFPDPVFRDYIAAEIDLNQNGVLDPGEAAEVKELYLSKLDIGSLQGIEYFTDLEILECSYNQLTALDVSKNTALQQLHCFENQLASLTVNNNDQLKALYCSNNQLTALDISKSTGLTVLNCSHNQLIELDVSNNFDLKWLDCYFNRLSKLDVSNNTQLKTLYCFYNQLTELDVSNNVNLTHLYCANNSLTELNVDNNPLLEELNWDGK